MASLIVMRFVLCSSSLYESINYIKSGNAATVLCTMHFGFVSPSFLSFCIGLNSAIYTLLLCVHLIIVLLFYYYLSLSLFYLGLKEKLSSYHLALWATFFFQVLNSSYSLLLLLLLFLNFYYYFFKYLYKLVYILLYWENKFHNY